tara:strand:- start:554 stop:5050 length:4497 start_codon:yes stop_codon:yes gene_type:complete
MIKGNIEIFQSYGNKNKSLYRGSNMVVDGFRKTIADVMTYMPNPSATPGYMDPGPSAVSSYQIQAMSLGSAKQGYSQRDSRFWYSALQTSASNYQLCPLNDNSVFEMQDCYSSLGFNQWQYDDVVDANLLHNPTLTDFNNWTVEYLYPELATGVHKLTDITSEGEIDITQFELAAGQQQVTLRQQVIGMELGGVYTLYTNGKSYNSQMTIRIARGRNGVPLEYYDFTSEKFISFDRKDKNINHNVVLKTYYDVDEFRFRLKGNKKDQIFLKNNEYFVEYIFPTPGFVDDSFAPWEDGYQNPYINIARLEVCDERHQILRNPNFLEHQSETINNDFDITTEFPSTEASNPTACTQAGLLKLVGWNQVNPLVKYANDPGNREDTSGLGAVFPLVSDDGRIFSGSTGVSLYVSSNQLDSSGTAIVEQRFTLGDEYRNKYAFVNDDATVPELLDQANTQYDNNPTLMLSFDTMVSGESTAANCGNLEITLTRDSDGFQYNFQQKPVNRQNDMFTAEGSAYKVSYKAKDTWQQEGVQVLLPPDASRQSYTVTINATGRSDGTNGFCYYSIKDFSLGKLAGWRTYVFDKSGIAKWSLSSTGSRVTPGNLFSGLTLSATYYNDLSYGDSAHTDILNSVQGIRVPVKTQIVQNFAGLEPTKTYRLSVKGTIQNTSQTPDFKYIVKAKSRAINNHHNALSLWMKDAADYSAVNTPTNLNPFSTNTLAHRATQPFFNQSEDAPGASPRNWGLLLQSSGTEASSITSTDLRANPGVYTLSMKTFNKLDKPSYFVLSSTAAGSPVFFNWQNGDWDQIVTGQIPAYRNAASGMYFLELPTGVEETYTYPSKIVFPKAGTGILSEYSDVTPDGFGSRGLFKFTAALYGPNAEAGECLVSDLSLDGPPLGPAVDIWKELYYNFTTGEWQPTPTSGGGYYSENIEDQPESFIDTPISTISKMCLYGLDRDTEYQVNIIDASGGTYTLHDVSLTDVSLVSNKGKARWVRDPNVWTSEPYGQTQYGDYTDGAVYKYRNNNNNTAIISNTQSPSAMTDWLQPASLMFRSTSGNTGNIQGPIFVPTMRIENTKSATFGTWLTENFTLAEYNIKGGEQFAVGMEAISVGASNDVFLMSIAAKYNGVRYTYNINSKEWTPGTEIRTKQFVLYNRGNQDPDEFYADAKTWNQLLSPVITAPNFGPETKITVSFINGNGGTGLRDVDFKTFKVYRYTDATPGVYHVSGETFNFPEFPKPHDDTLQSIQPSGEPGELGQFLNRINFFDYYVSTIPSQISAPGTTCVSGMRARNNPMAPSVTGEKTLEEAITMGAYLPSAGIFFGSGTFGKTNSSQSWGLSTSAGLVSGTLNQCGVVNSDGYIYRNTIASPANSGRDASAGFVVSSYVENVGGAATYGKKTVRYILKLHRDDWRFLDYYMGGIGALGLNTLDYKKTYDKLGTGFQLERTSNTYSAGSRDALYKVADTTKNPIFNLTNKKVTFPSGLKIDYDTTDHITIIWDINF